MSKCQISYFDCPEEDLCSRCKGSGNEPIVNGSDPCCSCDRCFDGILGWSTGIEPGSPSQLRAREFVRRR